jgi:hypothetical protein
VAQGGVLDQQAAAVEEGRAQETQEGDGRRHDRGCERLRVSQGE